MDHIFHDLRYAARLLRKSPGFTLTAMLVIAIGTGANSAIFSLVDTVLLRPLPYANPEQLVKVSERPPSGSRNNVSPLNFHDWAEQNKAFASMFALSFGSRTLTGHGREPERLPGLTVTPEFFHVLGVKPLAGRFFSTADDRPNPGVVVIGEGFWESHFARDPSLIGRPILLDGEQRVVIGVAPASFRFLISSNVYSLYHVRVSPEQRRMHYLQVYGRLKPGVGVAEARANMATVADGIAAASPETNKGWSANVDPLRESLVGQDLRTTSLVLGGVAIAVLLMGCANVAGLLVARGVGRTREIAVRTALGVTPGRLLQQLLTESLLLSTLGGLLGVAFAWIIVRAAPALLPPDTLPVALQPQLDARVLAFSALITITTGVLFGLAPALQAARLSLADTLRSGGRAASSGTMFRSVLAAGEIAVAVVLVAGAGLLVRTFATLNSVDPGFRTDHVVTGHLNLPLGRYPDNVQTLPVYQSMLREISTLPGVKSVGFGSNLPLDGWEIGQGFEVVGQPRDPEQSTSAHYQMVSPGWFDALGIRMVTGRGFTERDTAQSPQVCVVNEAFVRRELHGVNPLGARVVVQAMNMAGPKGIEREIVGVIHQVKVDGLSEQKDSTEIYVPQAQNPWYDVAMAVRAEGDPLTLLPAIKEAIARVDGSLPLTRIRTMDEVAAETIEQPRFRASLVSVFALLSLVLAAVGIFGVIAFSVSQRTREFGIRMALGAQSHHVLTLVLRRGAQIAGAGVLAGMFGALALTRFLSTLLFGVTPLDPLTFTVAPAVLAAVALAACATPAWRASRTNPAVALHSE